MSNETELILHEGMFLKDRVQIATNIARLPDKAQIPNTMTISQTTT